MPLWESKRRILAIIFRIFMFLINRREIYFKRELRRTMNIICRRLDVFRSLLDWRSTFLRSQSRPDFLEVS